VTGEPKDEDISRMKKSIDIDGRKTSEAKIERINKNTLKITVHEGRNRQVRRICDAGGYPVVKLKRIAVGSLELDLKKPGEWRYLTEEEVSRLL